MMGSQIAIKILETMKDGRARWCGDFERIMPEVPRQAIQASLKRLTTSGRLKTELHDQITVFLPGDCIKPIQDGRQQTCSNVVLQALQHQKQMTVAELREQTNMTKGRVARGISTLEMSGQVRRVGFGVWRLVE